MTWLAYTSRMTSAAAIQPRFPDLLRGWRKARKISQGNLSLDAGVSQRHLSFLESGRSSPSRDMVLKLAESLALPLREQNALLNAAGYASVYPHNDLARDELAQARHALELMLSYHEPFPAIVVDRNWNLLMANEANTRVFALFIDPVSVWTDIAPDSGNAAPNILRVTCHPRGLRPYLKNFDELARYFLRQLSDELAHNPYNREARELLDELTGYPDMPEPVHDQQAARPYLALELEKGSVSLESFTMISTFGTPLDVTLQEIRIETFLPANERTEQFLRDLS